MNSSLNFDLLRRDVPSAVWSSEAAKLQELARGKVVLEVGAEFGYSTIVLANAAERVHSVDWFKGDSMSGERETLAIYRQNLMEYGVLDNVITHVGDAAIVVPMFPEYFFDMAFIDAFHTEEAVHADIVRTLPKMKLSGIMAFHDYGRFTVAPAVDTFASGLGLEVKVVDHLAWVQLP